MAIHKLFSKILLIQKYHSTCVSFSCEFSKKRNAIFIFAFCGGKIIDSQNCFNSVVSLFNQELISIVSS